MSEDKRRLTVREICEISGMSKAWIGWKCREGDFPGAEKHRENGRLEWTVPEGELKNYMEDRRLGLKPRKRRKRAGPQPAKERKPWCPPAQNLMISSDALEIREATVRHQDEVILLLILQAIAAAQLSDVIATSSEALLVALEAVGWTKSPRELARLLHKLRAEERLKFESWFRVEEGEDERE